MEKIRALMEKCGLKPELAQQLCEAMENHIEHRRQQLEEDYTKRIAAAKKICVEETEAHKAELARRLQIFTEAKSQDMERRISKQMAIREGESVQTLEQIKALLEGFNLTDETGLQTKNKELTAKLTALKEERDRATNHAKRQTALAEKVLKRNREMEKKITMFESRDNGDGKPITEESRKRQRRRIDQNRQGGRASTTRRTLVESEERHAPADRRDSHMRTNDTSSMPNGHLTPAQIAETIDGEPV